MKNVGAKKRCQEPFPYLIAEDQSRQGLIPRCILGMTLGERGRPPKELQTMVPDTFLTPTPIPVLTSL
jgi:hypothetical protein